MKNGFPFYNGLAAVFTFELFSDKDTEFGWVDKEGKTVWREVIGKNSNGTNANANTGTNTNTTSGSNTNAYTTNTNVAVNTNASGNMNASPSAGGRTGSLITDANLRSEPSRDSTSVGIHFRGARVQILDETRYERDGEVATWYKIRVLRYGRSVNANLTGGKNTPYDADEGWVNAKLVSPS